MPAPNVGESRYSYAWRLRQLFGHFSQCESLPSNPGGILSSCGCTPGRAYHVFRTRALISRNSLHHLTSGPGHNTGLGNPPCPGVVIPACMPATRSKFFQKNRINDQSARLQWKRCRQLAPTAILGGGCDISKDTAAPALQVPGAGARVVQQMAVVRQDLRCQGMAVL